MRSVESPVCICHRHIAPAPDAVADVVKSDENAASLIRPARSSKDPNFFPC